MKRRIGQLIPDSVEFLKPPLSFNIEMLRTDSLDKQQCSVPDLYLIAVMKFAFFDTCTVDECSASAVQIGNKESPILQRDARVMVPDLIVEQDQVVIGSSA